MPVVYSSLCSGCDFLTKPSPYYHLKVFHLRQGKRMIGQQRLHWRDDDFGWEGRILRAEKRLIKRRLESSFGPSLQMSS